MMRCCSIVLLSIPVTRPYYLARLVLVKEIRDLLLEGSPPYSDQRAY